ncbi:hypothetical protein ACFE04_001212 [Oxalis oulophora]
MSRVYVGNLDPQVTERELEDAFHVFGTIRSVWVARRPPGYAFIDFDDRRDATDAIRDLDGDVAGVLLPDTEGVRAMDEGATVLEVEDLQGAVCHLQLVARADRLQLLHTVGGKSCQSYSPRGRSPVPRRRSPSPHAVRSYSRSPYRGREEVPYANGNGARERRRSRS